MIEKIGPLVDRRFGVAGWRTGVARAAMLAAAALCLLAATAAVQAQTPVTLVSNESAATTTASRLARARAFTTGANPGGYGLTGAQVAFTGSHTQSASSAVLVRIFSTTANGEPVVELARFIGPEQISSGLNAFTAPLNTVLDPDTSYALVITGSPSTGSRLKSLPVGLQRTQQISKHPDSLPDWGLASEARHGFQNETWATSSGLPVFSLEGSVRDPETVTEVWSATMNIGVTSAGTVDGYCDGPCYQGPADDIGSLADNSGFSGQPWSVESIRFDTSFDPDRLIFTVKDTASPATFHANDGGLLLKIRITDYDLNDVKILDAGHLTKTSYVWEAATSTASSAMALPAERRPWNDAASSTASTTATAVVKLIRRAASTTASSTASTSPTIAGPAQAGRTLSVGTDGIVDPDGLTSPTYGYQWIRVDGSLETDIGTATTTSTYTPGADDLGKKLKVRVSFMDDASNLETRLSAETSVVVPAAWTSCPAGYFWCGTLTAGRRLAGSGGGRAGHRSRCRRGESRRREP